MLNFDFGFWGFCGFEGFGYNLCEFYCDYYSCWNVDYATLYMLELGMLASYDALAMMQCNCANY